MTKQNTDEAKDANKKKIKIGDEEKWLLMDDDETKDAAELQEMISNLVAEAIKDMLTKK
jgi:hypothetical protein